MQVYKGNKAYQATKSKPIMVRLNSHDINNIRNSNPVGDHLYYATFAASDGRTADERSDWINKHKPKHGGRFASKGPNKQIIPKC